VTALRLGTRASPLALAQSRLVASELQRRHPGTQVTLVAMQTRGDRALSVPLAEVNDPEFFAAEIRAALRAGRIDFAVHSLKDLAPQSPPDLVRAALPPRADPRDVIVFRPSVSARLARGQPIRIGSSSGRRQANVAAFLPGALPALGPPPQLDFRPLRGGVDSRLQKILLPDEDPAALDGVILALAGLQRLHADADGRELIRPALAAARWMVLPLSRCPAASGQGVLAIECRQDDQRTRALLGLLDDPDSARAIALEEQVLARWPAALRPGLGATAIHDPELGWLCWLRGPGDTKVATADPVVALDWDCPPPVAGARPWDGASWRALARRSNLPVSLRPGSAIFIAHWRAAARLELPADCRLWVSGVASWERLAADGHWVEGCGDHLGFARLRALLAEPVLGLPPLAEWTALTHAAALPGWTGSGVGEVLASYRVSLPDDPDTQASLRAEAAAATHFYWHSSQPLELLRDALPPDGVHASGPGKTASQLEAAGLGPVQRFPDQRSWQQWLGLS